MRFLHTLFSADFVERDHCGQWLDPYPAIYALALWHLLTLLVSANAVLVTAQYRVSLIRAL